MSFKTHNHKNVDLVEEIITLIRDNKSETLTRTVELIGIAELVVPINRDGRQKRHQP